MVSEDEYLYFADRALHAMAAILTELGDELANVRPDLPGANCPARSLRKPYGTRGSATSSPGARPVSRIDSRSVITMTEEARTAGLDDHLGALAAGRPADLVVLGRLHDDGTKTRRRPGRSPSGPWVAGHAVATWSVYFAILTAVDRLAWPPELWIATTGLTAMNRHAFVALPVAAPTGAGGSGT